VGSDYPQQVGTILNPVFPDNMSVLLYVLLVITTDNSRSRYITGEFRRFLLETVFSTWGQRAVDDRRSAEGGNASTCMYALPQLKRGLDVVVCLGHCNIMRVMMIYAEIVAD
jgi:hypothetical protein